MEPDHNLFHLWNNCNACGMSPIFGKRYECVTCPLGPDSDLCGACHEKVMQGELKHPPPDNRLASDAGGEAHRFRCYEGTPTGEAEPWFHVPHAMLAAPNIADGFVVRPEFCSGFESTFAGYGFVVKAPGFETPLLLTALHVMDEMIKKKGIDMSGGNGAYTGRELPAVLTGVNLYNVYAANWMIASLGEAGPMLVLPEANLDAPEPLSDGDIAAFRVANPQGLAPAELAPGPPRVGQPIWLAACKGNGATQRAIKAVVVKQDERSLVFRYAENKLPPFTSGAPLIDAQGRVVGINVGGGDYREQRFGHANHVANIRRHLAQAC